MENKKFAGYKAALGAFLVIFVNIGVLMDAATPNEVIGVLAHESGHLAGGHLARLRQEIQGAQILSIAGLLAGAAMGMMSPYGRDPMKTQVGKSIRKLGIAVDNAVDNIVSDLR